MDHIDQTAEEVMDSLTGHDEMAISQHFGQTVMFFAEHNPTMLGRALVFVHQRRSGLNDDDARNIALDMPMKALTDYFPSETSEAGQESGKGEPVQPQPPAASLTSVS